MDKMEHFQAVDPETGEVLHTLQISDPEAIKTDTAIAFTEADTKSNIESGENIPTLFGKIKKWISTLINLGNPMVYKGTLGPGGTIEDLPTPSEENAGFTYKVIEDGTYGGVEVKNGDTVISDKTEWTVIPSGDEPGGTVTKVDLSMPAGFSVTGNPITTKGTITVSMDSGYFIPTLTEKSKWDANLKEIKAEAGTHIGDTGTPSVTANTVDGKTTLTFDYLKGAKGDKGDKGDTGATGAQGPAGKDGAQGPQGIQGPAGKDGVDGVDGKDGAQGPQGLKGDKGDTGATGPQGPQGLKGDKGDTGATGPQGLKGDKGDTGAQGPQGLKGDKGDTGAQGPQGPKGDTGSVASVTTTGSGNAVTSVTMDATTKAVTATKGATFGTYSKPSGGIPKSDLASAVQASLGKADTALQSVVNKNIYASCSTASAGQVKVITLDNSNETLNDGDIIYIKFTNSNSFSVSTGNEITFKIGNDNYNIRIQETVATGTNTSVYGYAKRIIWYKIDKTNKILTWLGHGNDNNTTYTNQSLGNGYGTCTTAAATAAKVVTLSGYNLTINGYVSVKFTYDVPANATLNINGKGAKNIFYKGAKITAGVIKAGVIATFVYDGTQYQLVSIDVLDFNNIDDDKTGDTITWSSNKIENYISQLDFMAKINPVGTGSFHMGYNDNTDYIPGYAGFATGYKKSVYFTTDNVRTNIFTKTGYQTIPILSDEMDEKLIGLPLVDIFFYIIKNGRSYLFNVDDEGYHAWYAGKGKVEWDLPESVINSVEENAITWNTANVYLQVNNKASGESSVAIGSETEASGKYSFAAGYCSKAKGEKDFAIGSDAIADGGDSGGTATAIGHNTKCYAAYGVALGAGAYVGSNAYSSVAIGYADSYHSDSYAIGYGVETGDSKQIVLGTYNEVTKDKFIIGGGTGSSARKNLFRITPEGRIYGNGPIHNNMGITPAVFQAASNTLPALINELRYKNGCMGSVALASSYTYGSVTFPAQWYTYLYIPHRGGGDGFGKASGDNHQYGILLLFGMTANKTAMWQVSFNSSGTIDGAVRR